MHGYGEGADDAVEVGGVCYSCRSAPMNVVLMGPPGVGKGTQSQSMRIALRVPHVSTGDILRQAVQQDTALGREARPFVESGKLVPDELMGDMIAERLGRKDARAGFILDGFPRTREQVVILDRVLKQVGVRLDRVFMMTTPEFEIVRRLSGRRSCPKCGVVYHLESRPPAVQNVCDACGSALVQRPDDAEDVIRQRLEVYGQQTLPVAEIYRSRGLLREVDGTGDAEIVFDRLKAELDEV